MALLTKGPALILLPFVGLLLWAAALRRGAGLFRGAGLALRWYLPWLGGALLLVVVLRPALWSVPVATLRDYIGEIVGNGGRPNGDGQFFLGRAVADPGPWFYLFADLMRSTPALLAGLLLALPWRGADRRRWVLLALLAFVCWWTLVMMLGAKKFDRYVLPTWPLLCVLGGVGLARLLAAGRTLALRRGALAALLAADAALLAWYHPYALSYYNPLFGGGATAQRTLLIGWGEGMDQVGAWLRARPDIGEGVLLSALPPTLQPFVPVPVNDALQYGHVTANYAVVYLESLQRAADPAVYTQIQQTIPLHTVRIHGIEYARIYQLPKPFATPVNATFGDTIALRGVTLAPAAGQITLTPAWDVRGQPPADYQLFVHVIAPDGTRVAQADIAPGGGNAPPTSAWQPGQQIAVPITLPLPADLAAGEYTVLLGLYDPLNGARLPVGGTAPADPALSGPDAVVVGAFRR